MDKAGGRAFPSGVVKAALGSQGGSVMTSPHKPWSLPQTRKGFSRSRFLLLPRRVATHLRAPPSTSSSSGSGGWHHKRMPWGKQGVGGLSGVSRGDTVSLPLQLLGAARVPCLWPLPASRDLPSASCPPPFPGLDAPGRCWEVSHLRTCAGLNLPGDAGCSPWVVPSLTSAEPSATA